MIVRSNILADVLAVLAVMLLAVGTALVQGQEDPPATAETGGESSRMVVYPLMRIDASEACELVQELGLAVQIVADERTNSLIVQVPDQSSRDQIGDLIKVLDGQPAPAVELLSTRMEITPAAEDVIRTLGTGVVQAVDAQRQLIVVKGHEQQVVNFKRSLEELEAFSDKVERYRREQIVETSQPGFLRVVWLMNGLEPAVTRPVPESMAAAIEKLGAVGITELRYLTQILTNVGATESEFSAAGTISVPAGIHISVSGQRTPEGRFQIRITTQQRQESSGSVDRQFDTESIASVALSPGQFVVLGASPCGGLDSVFVVEFVPQ